MRFDEPSRSSDDPIRPNSIVPDPDRTSRAIRTRLLMLFGMLLLVIILMNEAGKPERWEWMGFDRPNTDQESGNSDTIELQTGEPDPASSESDQRSEPEDVQPEAVPALDLATAADSGRPINIRIADSKVAAKPLRPSLSQGLTDDGDSYPEAAARFWRTIVRDFSDSQRAQLLRMLKSIRWVEPFDAEEQLKSRQLVRVLAQLREQFQQNLFDELALAPEGTPEKTRLAEAMFESQELWEQRILPALNSAIVGEELTMVQLNDVVRLQRVLDPFLLELVQDRTSIGWAGDSPAWKRLWEKALSDDSDEFARVTHIKLMGQPEYYRGQPITVAGWVRSARKESLPQESEIGLDHYFIHWVRPRESKLGPYCIYSSSLPEGFPQLTDSYNELNQNVKFKGYFFKVRTYVAADQTVKNCPLIIASDMEIIQPVEFTAVDQWQPSRYTLAVAFIIIPLFATGLAWFVFQSSRTRSYQPGKTRQAQIDEKLGDLSNDPNVQSDHEKVLALYEMELDDD